jgi:predicted GTPase
MIAWSEPVLWLICKKFVQAIRKEFFARSQFPILFVFAKFDLNVENILHKNVQLVECVSQTISPGKLHRIIQDLIERQPTS